jgi:hypothetical protein
MIEYSLAKFRCGVKGRPKRLVLKLLLVEVHWAAVNMNLHALWACARPEGQFLFVWCLPTKILCIFLISPVRAKYAGLSTDSSLLGLLCRAD